MRSRKQHKLTIPVMASKQPMDRSTQSIGRVSKLSLDVGCAFLAFETGTISKIHEIMNRAPETNWSSGVFPVKISGNMLEIRKKGDHATGLRMGHANGLILCLAHPNLCSEDGLPIPEGT